MRTFVLILLLCIAQLKTQAQILEKITIKNADKSNTIDLQLVGAAVQLRLSKPIYTATLYSSNKSHEFTTNNTMLMEIKIITADLSHKTLADIWQGGIIVNMTSSITNKQSDDIATFIDLLKEEFIVGQAKLAIGDHLQIIYRPQHGTTIILNQTPLGFFEGYTLFPLLLKSWTGKVPPGIDFKRKITGTDDNITPTERKLLIQYNALLPTPERINTIKIAFNKKKTLLESISTLPAIEQKKMPSSKKEKPIKTIKKQQTTQTTSKPTTLSPISKTYLQKKQQEENKRTQDQLRLYYSTIKSTVSLFQKYPKVAIKKGLSGTVLFSVTATRNGNYTFSIKESSNSSLLDHAAKFSMIEAKNKLTNEDLLPALPETMDGDTFEFMLSLTYILPGKKRRRIR